MIRFQCPSCKSEMTVDNSYAGRSGNCSWCGGAMTVPEPYSPGTTTDEERDPAVTAVTSAVDNLRSTAPKGSGAGSDPGEIDISLPQYRQQDDSQLSPGDIALCIFCSGIACIIGLVRLVQGRPNAAKMIGLSFLCSAFWTFVRLMIESAIRR